MHTPRNLSLIPKTILLILLTISFYHGIISPPPLITFTTDENFIGESGIFLLYGITPKNLEWAALPSTFFAYFIFIVWCIFTLIAQSTSIKTLEDILSVFDKNALHYLNHREEFVIWERWIQLILVGFIIYKTIQFILKSKNPTLKPELKFILIFLCICSDTIWIAVPIIRPEAISGSLFLFLSINILFTEKITPKIATFLVIIFILTFSQRLIYLFFSPFVLGSIFIHLRGQKLSLKTYLNYFTVIILALLAFMPFILTNTFVILKSFFGIISAKINHDEMSTYFNVTYINNFVKNPLNLIFSLLCIVGIWFLFKFQTIKSIVIILMVNFLFFLYSSLRAAQLYETHTFPLSMIAIILASFGVYGLMSFLEENLKKMTITILSFFIFTNTIWTIQKHNTLTIAQQQNLNNARNWIKTLKDNDKILLSLDFDGLIPKNKVCLLREYEANASENYRINKLHKLLKMPESDSISKFTIPVLAQSFGFEDEKLFDTQYQIALKYIDSDSTKRYDTDYFFDNNTNMSHCYVQDVALQRFKEGKYKYIISHKQMLNLKPIKSFNKEGSEMFWAYEFNERGN